MTDRKKPGVAFWTTVTATVLMLLVYPLSAGPAAWMMTHRLFPIFMIWLYTPLNWVYERGPEPIRMAFRWYVDLWKN
jgi:hypothetical protein